MHDTYAWVVPSLSTYSLFIQSCKQVSRLVPDCVIWGEKETYTVLMTNSDFINTNKEGAGIEGVAL